jgi:GAF domain-containing protein
MAMNASQPDGPPIPDLADALTELVDLLLSTPDVDDLFADVARLAARVVTPTASCGVTVRRDSRPVTAAASDDLAAQVDEVQYSEGEGPCLDALHIGKVVTVTDLAVEERWPGYRPRAMDHGVRSSLSLPLTADGDVRGALNLYSPAPAAFVNGSRQRAKKFAEQASAALTVAVRQAKQTELTIQLRNALASRTVIDQAIGILMDQQRCNADGAFELLRSASQHQNRKLRDLAADIVRAVGGGEPRAGPFREPS